MKGLGTDIVEVERIENSIKRYGNRFLNKLFTQSEIAYCNNNKNATQHFAGRFAAKEAIAKALGTGFGKQLKFHDIEIKNTEQGKPVVKLSSSAQDSFNVSTLLLSISHCKKFAQAVAIWVS